MADGPIPTETQFPTFVNERENSLDALREEDFEAQQQEQQPTPNTGERRRETLKYSDLMLSKNGQHCTVYFTNEETLLIYSFEGMERLCLMMDDQSVQKFRNRVAKLQLDGYLQELASPEAQVLQEEERQAEQKQARQAKRQDLNFRMKEFDRKVIRQSVAALSNDRLVAIVTSRLMEALDKPELNPVFDELLERDLVLKISVEDSYGCQKVADLTINPHDLISGDVSNVTTELEAERKALLKEALELELDNY